MENRITPHIITSLDEFEIIVFGSNSKGKHFGGLAKVCHEKFGAKMGFCKGFTGQCYAIDTMSGIDVLKEQIEPFCLAARSNPRYTFYLTLIATGIAGHTAETVAPLFMEAKDITNIKMPIEFWNIILKIEK